jgi:hypothetical protein
MPAQKIANIVRNKMPHHGYQRRPSHKQPTGTCEAFSRAKAHIYYDSCVVAEAPTS